MIKKINQYSRPEIFIKPHDYDHMEWNGKSVADNGWFYADVYSHIFFTKWKIGMIATIVNPDILDIFTAEENDDYSHYGFVKHNNKWYKKNK